MTPDGGVYVATIPAQPDGTRVDYTVTRDGRGADHHLFVRLLLRRDAHRDAARAERERRAALRGIPGARSRTRHRGQRSRSAPPATTTTSTMAPAAINIYRSTNGISRVHAHRRPARRWKPSGTSSPSAAGFRLDLTDSVEKTTSPWHTTILPDPLATPAPLVLTIAELNAAPELYEGRLVSVASVSIVSGAIPSAPPPLDAFVIVGDGTGSFVMKIDHDTDVEGFTPASVFTLTRHRPAGRFPAAVRFELRHRAAEPRRSRRGGAGAAAAADASASARRSRRTTRISTRRRTSFPI